MSLAVAQAASPGRSSDGTARRLHPSFDLWRLLGQVPFGTPAPTPLLLARFLYHSPLRYTPIRPSCSAEATSQACAPDAAARRKSAASRIPPAPISRSSGRSA